MVQNSSYVSRLEMGREEFGLKENNAYASRLEMKKVAIEPEEDDHYYDYIPSK